MIIQSRRVYYQEELQPLQIEVQGGKIKAVYPYNQKQCDEDYGEYLILPGLIDIHNHGYHGCDANHANKEWLQEWMKYLPSEGVTSTLPSTSSAPKESILKAMNVIAEVMEEGCEGAHILGIYSEGPFMCEKYRGAQDLRYLTVPTKQDIDEYLAASRNHLVYCMVAPEMFEGDMSVIRYLREKGVAVACGHTGATFEEITQAREAGAQSFTHTYNGMRGLHHREAGVVGAAMYYDDMYAELIGDGVHVSFPSMNVLAKCKGKDRLISVTDSVALKGFPCGHYNEMGYEFDLCEDGVGRLLDGTICGSANRLCQILRREIENAHIPYVTAINSVTANPANLIGYGDRKGRIREGYDADLTILNEEYEPVQTYVDGKKML